MSNLSGNKVILADFSLINTRAFQLSDGILTPARRETHRDSEFMVSVNKDLEPQVKYKNYLKDTKVN